MKKRVCSVFFSVMMLMAMLSVGVATVSAEPQATVTVSSAVGQKGDVVEIVVTITENSYLVNADMTLTFDPEKLEPDDTYYADPDGDEGDTLCYRMNTSLFPSSWMCGGNVREAGEFYFAAASSGHTGLTAGAEMFRVAFRILTDEPGDIAVMFAADPMHANDGTGELDEFGYPIDSDLDLSIVNGVVTVEKATMPGDVNGDGAVDMMDAFQVFNAASSGNASEALLAAGDMNGDGVIDMMDAFAVFRIASGS